ncbi:septation protein SepH [Corynebacterium silvaticum]|uniref:Septation protein SepH n=1 Tax=Corynebacterium silvaticum TaxID=2320431 RepID=A0A7Y4P909_9CORY|nr:septation protein SepH [Corynebacterium silvaticum]ARU45770.1 septation protein SepH [Corynebacterium silvaticum]MBH5300314.1 DUF3071 domain-containing protein [Corynebacterium silvaticum]NOM64510.1 DUF3071 domain-containing protein [Corynebacterium silvaticum]NON70004.1 DUF3071 domain-containing protein [Corynebacterium silvaticum]TFA93164.1 DUF3071 domain-containing protein [Corynebacterium silvaticum]
MQELVLIPSESTKTSLVFHAAESPEDQYFLVVDDSLRATLLGKTSEDQSPAATNTAEADSAADVKETASEPEEARPADVAAVSPVSTATDAPEQRELRTKEMDPRLSTPLAMRPREIQDRIRGGATVAQLAEENGVTESRIEPYAHPVLLERARIADMAKQSHPVRDDGPARLTLWEVLVTAFAARGLDLSTTQWDAYRDASGQWIATVSWKSGVSDLTAEWSYHRNSMSSTTAIARNGIAADLIDPDFIQPVRTISPVGRPRAVDVFDNTRSPEAPQDPHAESEVEKTRDDLPPITDAEEAQREISSQDSIEVSGEGFFQSPDQQPKTPSKRRRKAVTPHWEDVLLGVRTNTKRPRS